MELKGLVAARAEMIRLKVESVGLVLSKWKSWKFCWRLLVWVF